MSWKSILHNLIFEETVVASLFTDVYYEVMPMMPLLEKVAYGSYVITALCVVAGVLGVERKRHGDDIFCDISYIDRS